MVLPVAMNQDNVFYTTEWTKEDDKIFIKGLVEQTIVGNPIEGGLPNRRAISYCRDRVNGELIKNFSYRTCLERFQKLYTRYLVFTSIISKPRVQHDHYTNVITADDATWEIICRENSLGRAYIERGEEEYDNLCFIFNGVPDEGNAGTDMVEVIQISSDTEDLSMGDRSESVDFVGDRSVPSSVASSSPFKP